LLLFLDGHKEREKLFPCSPSTFNKKKSISLTTHLSNKKGMTTETKDTACFIARLAKGYDVRLERVFVTKEKAEEQMKIWKKELRDLWFKGKPHDLRAFPDFLISGRFLDHYAKKRVTFAREGKPAVDPDTTLLPFARYIVTAKDFFEVYQDYQGQPFTFESTMKSWGNIFYSDSRILREQILTPLSKGKLPDPEEWWKLQQSCSYEAMWIEPSKMGEPQSIEKSLAGHRSMASVVGGEFFRGSVAQNEADEKEKNFDTTE